MPALLALLLLAACGGDTSGKSAGSESGKSPELALLNGSVVLQPKAPLRLDAVVRVRLVDVSLADAPAMIISQQDIPARGQPVPVPFSLEYDLQRIKEHNRYALRAEIRDAQGTLLWVTTSHHPVLTHGAPVDAVEVLVEPLTRPH